MLPRDGDPRTHAEHWIYRGTGMVANLAAHDMPNAAVTMSMLAELAAAGLALADRLDLQGGRGAAEALADYRATLRAALAPDADAGVADA